VGYQSQLVALYQWLLFRAHALGRSSGWDANWEGNILEKLSGENVCKGQIVHVEIMWGDVCKGEIIHVECPDLEMCSGEMFRGHLSGGMFGNLSRGELFGGMSDGKLLDGGNLWGELSGWTVCGGSLGKLSGDV